jgi:hypothetical protein
MVQKTAKEDPDFKNFGKFEIQELKEFFEENGLID